MTFNQRRQSSNHGNTYWSNGSLTSEAIILDTQQETFSISNFSTKEWNIWNNHQMINLFAWRACYLCMLMTWKDSAQLAKFWYSVKHCFSVMLSHFDGTMTFSIMVFGIMTLGIMTYNIFTFSIMTLSITTLNIMTVSIMTISMTIQYRLAECHNAECRIFLLLCWVS